MVCHVDFSVEAIQLSSPPFNDSEINKVAQLPWGRGGGLQNGKIAGPKPFVYPLGWKLFATPPSLWLKVKLQATF